jgi:hypothetical protein
MMRVIGDDDARCCRLMMRIVGDDDARRRRSWCASSPMTTGNRGDARPCRSRGGAGSFAVRRPGDLNGFDGSWIDDGELSGFDWDGGDGDGFDLFPTDFDLGSWDAGDWFGPIVLDLDGNGVDIVGREDSPVWFNVDGDAALEKTAWAGKNDGFLVIDLAASGGTGAPDGQITQAKELSFAAWTADPDDTDAQRCGFPAIIASRAFAAIRFPQAGA